jgi:hypothetical protein
MKAGFVIGGIVWLLSTSTAMADVFTVSGVSAYSTPTDWSYGAADLGSQISQQLYTIGTIGGDITTVSSKDHGGSVSAAIDATQGYFVGSASSLISYDFKVTGTTASTALVNLNGFYSLNNSGIDAQAQVYAAIGSSLFNKTTDWSFESQSSQFTISFLANVGQDYSITLSTTLQFGTYFPTGPCDVGDDECAAELGPSYWAYYSVHGGKASAFIDPLLSLDPSSGGGDLRIVADIPSAVAGAEGAVPDASSWTLMLSGFGLIGCVMRKRRTVVPPHSFWQDIPL